MERLKELKCDFIDIIEMVLKEDLSKIDAQELGEIVDCLKDISETMYYCSVVKAMEENNYSKEMIPTEVRERMYYNPEKETEE